VLDGATWTVVAGPWKDRVASWVYAEGADSLVGVMERGTGALTQVADVAGHREIPLATDRGAQGVQPLPGGSFAVIADSRRVDLLDRDGGFVRTLYPSDE
jgi:hypothetical protein